VSARGGILDGVEWDVEPAEITVKHRYATLRAVGWRAGQIGRFRPRVGAGLELGYLLRSHLEAKWPGGAASVGTTGFSDLDIGPVFVLGVYTGIRAMEAGVETSYVHGLRNINDSLNRTTLGIRSRAVRVALRLVR
jgi:hypothetical protein